MNMLSFSLSLRSGLHTWGVRAEGKMEIVMCAGMLVSHWGLLPSTAGDAAASVC